MWQAKAVVGVGQVSSQLELSFRGKLRCETQSSSSSGVLEQFDLLYFLFSF